jgi:hypothetical protein
VNGTAVDRAGNTATAGVTLNIDLTAPAITIAGVADGASYPLCSLPTPSYTATDNLSGVISQSALLTPPSNANGAGLYTYSVTAADTAGNSRTMTAAYRMVYGFGGFQPPVTLDRPFKKGSTIPVKFMLDNGGGAATPTATATLTLQFLSGTEPAGDPIIASSNVPDSGNLFRYASEEGMYIYNLATGDLAAGVYLAVITTDDGMTRTVTIQIKQ